MAKKKKISENHSDDQKIQEWLGNGNNKITKIEKNVCGEAISKSFFSRRRKPQVKPTQEK